MRHWQVKVIKIEYENRYERCIVGEDFVLGVEFLSEDFVDCIIRNQNKSVSEAYNEGIKTGAEIAKEVYEELKSVLDM